MADIIQVDTDKILSGKQISKIIDNSMIKNQQYLVNRAYYEGKNPPIIIEGKEKDRDRINPNNVIPLPFARRTVNDLQGYAYKPHNVKYEYDAESNEDLVTMINDIMEYNDEPLVSSEIFQDSSINGEGAELLYFADEMIQFAKIPRSQCCFKFVDSVKEDKLEYAIRFYTVIEINRDGKEDKIHYADLYDSAMMHTYKYIQKENELNKKEYMYESSAVHPFMDVPLYPYRINEDQLGIYQASIPIIARLDEFGSNSIANALDQFNKSILLLSKKISEIDKENINDWGFIDDLGGKEEGNFVEFLHRNLSMEGTLESTRLFERWYYELTGVPNLNDDKFGVKSGIAIAYALVSFENLVTTMETYFSKGLLYRLQLINQALIFFSKTSDIVTASIKWERNLPFDLRERTEIAVLLKNSGLLSDETILKMFPSNIVQDALAEIEQRDSEDEKSFAKQQGKEQLMIDEPKMDESEEN